LGGRSDNRMIVFYLTNKHYYNNRLYRTYMNLSKRGEYGLAGYD